MQDNHCNMGMSEYLFSTLKRVIFLQHESYHDVVKHSLREKRVPKRCPWGTIATNGTLFFKAQLEIFQ